MKFQVTFKEIFMLKMQTTLETKKKEEIQKLHDQAVIFDRNGSPELSLPLWKEAIQNSDLKVQEIVGIIFGIEQSIDLALQKGKQVTVDTWKQLQELIGIVLGRKPEYSCWPRFQETSERVSRVIYKLSL